MVASPLSLLQPYLSKGGLSILWMPLFFHNCKRILVLLSDLAQILFIKSLRSRAQVTPIDWHVEAHAGMRACDVLRMRHVTTGSIFSNITSSISAARRLDDHYHISADRSCYIMSTQQTDDQFRAPQRSKGIV